ncbi:MAG TPA: 5'/3'-nucleotidase SurE [Pirellulales bacterium]
MRKILLTNDDGVAAPGLAEFAGELAKLGKVTIVTPAVEMSGCGHQVTTHRPLQLTQLAPHIYSVDGTPADCVRLALSVIDPEIEWVVSGVNAGGNLGADVYHSGTVAAAREGALLGRFAVAASHYRKKGLAIDWAFAARVAVEMIGRLDARTQAATAGAGIAEGSGESLGRGFWNVNLPHGQIALRSDGSGLPEWAECFCDPSAMPIQFAREGDSYRYGGNYHERPRLAGGDVSVCFGGRVAVSRLPL